MCSSILSLGINYNFCLFFILFVLSLFIFSGHCAYFHLLPLKSICLHNYYQKKLFSSSKQASSHKHKLYIQKVSSIVSIKEAILIGSKSMTVTLLDFTIPKSGVTSVTSFIVHLKKSVKLIRVTALTPINLIYYDQLMTCVWVCIPHSNPVIRIS